jgi:methionyl-tRNA formyltransferase
MEMDAGLDTGPVYIREAIAIEPADTAQTLHDRLAALGAGMVRRHLDDILSGALLPAPQEDAAATYAPMIKKEEGELDWGEPAVALERRVRAMTPWPGAYTWWQGARLRVIAASPRPETTPDGPGAVRRMDGDIVVGTGTGSLQLLEVQPAGGRVMAVDAFVHGHPDFVGSRLERDEVVSR